MDLPDPVPTLRVRPVGSADVRPEGRYVLYWMTAARRTRWSHALDHAVRRARELDRPLLVLEALRCDYLWASDRHHAFVLRGMADNAAALEAAGVGAYPYVEPAPGAGRGLLAALAEEACLVVADDSPVFFLPRMLAAAARRTTVRIEAVDGCGLLPLRATERAFARAYDLRRFLQRELVAHLEAPPAPDPLAGARLRPPADLPEDVRARWPRATPELLAAAPAALSALPIDHEVGAVPSEGGSHAGRRRLDRFVADHLAAYGEERNQPDLEGASGLSPYLHFGHLSAHEVLAALAVQERWTPEQAGGVRSGAREGWWGMSASAEAFLDQLVTWRELNLNFAHHRDDLERYSSLPDWARETLELHASDPRPYRYSLEEFDAAGTHDELWNAAQTELRTSGRMHNYLRMLWGKKILHWSDDPRAALAVMVELNNRHALDGRDPNSYGGIFWVLGRYDRPWGPEREVFGKVRFMSGKNTRRKLRLNHYLERWGRRAPRSEPGTLFPT